MCSPCEHVHYNKDVRTKKTTKRKSLTDYSEKDKPWVRHRSNVEAIREIYNHSSEFEGLAKRLSECSGVLAFGWEDNPDTGESSLKLRKAQFCRIRYCPVCQWRRSLMWQARFHQALPSIVAKYPKARWLFLTLTVRNCEITDLRATLQLMNKSWNKFIKRKELKIIDGWIRTTEVTKGEDRSAHPHFHVLMMVPERFFQGKYYVKQSRWVELWQESLQANYAPNVDIRTVKPKKGTKKTLNQISTIELLQGAVSETLKYSTKADDLMVDRQWFYELTRQTHKLRFMASGGALKNILKEGKETDDELALVDGDGSKEKDEKPKLLFEWDVPDKNYYKRGK